MADVEDRGEESHDTTNSSNQSKVNASFAAMENMRPVRTAKSKAVGYLKEANLHSKMRRDGELVVIKSERVSSEPNYSMHQLNNSRMVNSKATQLDETKRKSNKENIGGDGELKKVKVDLRIYFVLKIK